MTDPEGELNGEEPNYIVPLWPKGPQITRPKNPTGNPNRTD